MNLKKNINKMLSYVGKKKSKHYAEYLRQCGVKVGKNVLFSSPRKTWIDTTRPGYLSIGDDCVITQGVTILAHDWSYSILAKKYKKIVGQKLWTEIGNNVFIGVNSTILMGTTIGDNVIIGAGSVVTGKVESDSVYMGNPARKVYTLDEYLARSEARYIKNSKVFVDTFELKKGRKPNINELGEYRALFMEKSSENLNKFYPNCDYLQESVKNMPLLYPDYFNTEEEI